MHDRAVANMHPRFVGAMLVSQQRGEARMKRDLYRARPQALYLRHA